MTTRTDRRFAIGSATLSLLVAFYLLAVFNLAFWRHALIGFGGVNAAFLAFSAALTLLTIAGMVALSVKYLIKPFLIFLLISGAIASYYADVFGIVIDREMMRNVVVTTPQEAKHLITPQFFLHVLFYGVVPSLLVALVRVRHRRFLGKLVHNSAIVVASLMLAAGLILSHFAAIASTVREHHEMMARINPFGPMSAAINLGIMTYDELTLVRRPIGTDAHVGPLVASSSRPVVTVIVAGETARSMNFSLNGYARPTNPELAALDVLNFTHTTSCGTETAVSLPCMFSVYPRVDYTDRKGRSTDSLIDILDHAGIDAYWWDNNTGSKGVADRVSYESFNDAKDVRYCREGECDDGIFLDRLDAKLAGITSNTTIVLHQIGSHGPSYFLRYPEAFERFQPACHTAQLTDCSPQEIVNAYDNTVLYTDHFLASVIGLLQKNAARIDGAMIYMSDHGESLGENGLYLHGAPYALAPEQQTHVPFVAWFTDGFASRTGLSLTCLRAKADAPMSHDNLFHTVLGLMNIETSVYDGALDAFASCRAPSGNAPLQS